MAAATATRRLARDVLVRVGGSAAYGERALHAALGRADLPPRDRALVTEIVYGTLRHQAALDAQLSAFAPKLDNLPLPVLAALRLGAYQLLYTRVPARSAVHESVALVGKYGRLRGLVNAVLRKVAAGAKPLTALAALPADPAALATATSHPAWLVEALIRERGLADTQALLTANNVTPPVALRINRCRATRAQCKAALESAGIVVETPESGGYLRVSGEPADRDKAGDNATTSRGKGTVPVLGTVPDLCSITQGAGTVPKIGTVPFQFSTTNDQALKGGSAQALKGGSNQALCPEPDTSPFAHSLSVRRAGAVTELPGFAQGDFTVQDLAATLVGYLASPQPGDFVLDACAAPGGKATHLAELMNDTGQVLAVEKHPGKSRLIAENADRLKLESIAVAVADATDPEALATLLGEFERTDVDLAVLDAPCAGMGTLRRNPELRQRGAEALPDLLDLQARLLHTVSGCVRLGGALVYAVCSLTEAEGPQQIEAFLKSHPQFRLEAPPASLQQFTEGRYLRTWTHLHGTDCFFAARLVRHQ